MTVSAPLFAHVIAMTDVRGLFEHAQLTAPRPAHGYCVDDVARGLIALCRSESASPDGTHGNDTSEDSAQAWALDGASAAVLRELAWTYARFLERSQDCDGRIVNRCDTDGTRQGGPEVGDCWGRALWAFGTAAGRSRDGAMAAWARTRFDVGAAVRSPWPRAMAFAGLGAAELMRVDPGHAPARRLLADAAAAVGSPGPDPDWPWPEPRLTYANAVLPDVLMAAGDCLNEDVLVQRGLRMLDWLLALQTPAGHLSLTPAAGWGRGEPLPGFDQQPIEAATLADACARAYELTGETRWSDAVEAAHAWFHGRNDAGIPLYDATTGGCCDGLEPAGRNENQGAESTLALISTAQHASRLAGAGR